MDRWDRLDWARIGSRLDAQGHALLPGLLDGDEARALAREAMALPGLVPLSLASCDLGHGELLRWGADLPRRRWPAGAIASTTPPMAPVADRWNAQLGLGFRHPPQFDAFVHLNQQADQVRPLSHLLRLGESGHVLLHQCRTAPLVFPLQLVLLLSQPGLDFEGGEFVMTEQRPRMQSRPMVLPLQLGDAAIVCTGARPVLGGTGAYRVQLRHAISQVRRGEWLGLELLLHDGLP